jgi:hypothetical protein
MHLQTQLSSTFLQSFANTTKSLSRLDCLGVSEESMLSPFIVIY